MTKTTDPPAHGTTAGEERYFEDSDESGHHYVVPWSRRKEWAVWRDLPEDDERAWEAPTWATRIDGGTLTFTDPRIDRR